MLTRSLAMIACSTVAHAKYFGQYGPVFEIQEKSLLTVITQKLNQAAQTGQLETLTTALKQRIAHKAGHPTPTILSKTTKTRTIFLDPTLTVSKNLTDHQNKTFATKGDEVTPSTHVPFGESLVFIDGEDDDQVAWGLAQKGRLVLTNGAPLELSQTHHRPIYFDQQGQLTTAFQIQNVPAVVSQEGAFLKVDEVVMPTKEGGQ